MKTLTPMTDAQRAAAVQWMPQAAKIALRKAGSVQRADVDDAVQEAFLQTCRSVQTFRPEAGVLLRTHLYNCVDLNANTVFHAFEARGFTGLKGKKGSDRPPIPSVAGGDALAAVEFGCGEGEAEGAVERADEREWVWQAVDRLADERQREVIRLRFRRGWTLAQVGWHLDLTKEAVRQIELKALEALRESLAGVEGVA